MDRDREVWEGGRGRWSGDEGEGKVRDGERGRSEEGERGWRKGEGEGRKRRKTNVRWKYVIHVGQMAIDTLLVYHRWKHCSMQEVLQTCA